MTNRAHDSLFRRLAHKIGLVRSRGSAPSTQRPTSLPPRPETPVNTGRPAIAPDQHPFRDGNSPKWASNWGEDRYGVWADFMFEDVTQRLRWIVPGDFLMGAPRDEPGREDDECPLHRVTVTEGYWLFDTPVTQALWVAVMGKNPSQFQSPDRPVETVSFDDAEAFIKKVNDRIIGIDLILPTEAQWEYACRAGSEAATYAGPVRYFGTSNAPVLDPIAWYDGNCGVNFDLKDGEKAFWGEKQHNFEICGTRAVMQKLPNSWGLYDMLGNVWEWCADDLRAYTEEDEIDPAGPLDTPMRTLRGGSWNGIARRVRAATRSQLSRDGRDYVIGFRCARGRN